MSVFDLHEAQKKEERKGQSKAHFLDQTRNFAAIHSASETKRECRRGICDNVCSYLVYTYH